MQNSTSGHAGTFRVLTPMSMEVEGQGNSDTRLNST